MIGISYPYIAELKGEIIHIPKSVAVVVNPRSKE